jgi:hypothetical protein
MTLKYVTNEGTSPIYVAGRMIAPGEGRHVEVPGAPALGAAESSGPSIDEQLAKLMEHGVGKIVPQLHELTNEALDRLEDLEQAGKNRSTLIGAIAAERIARANAAIEGDEQAKHDKALHDAEGELLAARVALDNLPVTAKAKDRRAAETLIEEAQAKVDALKDSED